MIHQHPALNFPLYGLDDSWDGPRWLDFAQGQRGEPVWAVDLGHSDSRAPSPNRSWVMVAVSPRDWHSQLMAPPESGRDYRQEVALETLSSLLSRTSPPEAFRDDPSYRQAEGRLLEDQAAGSANWSVATWFADGEPLSASIFEWAGAWAGFTLDLSDVTVRVLEVGTEPSGLRLARIKDSSRYHFDTEQPINFPETLESSANAALGPDFADVEAAWPLHPDHEKLRHQQAP